MESMPPINDVQRLYKEWQDGKLLDSEERQALRGSGLDNPPPSFADALKRASDVDTAR